MVIRRMAIRNMQITLEQWMHNDESNLQCKCDCAGADNKESILYCVVSFTAFLRRFSVMGKLLVFFSFFFQHSDSALLTMQT